MLRFVSLMNAALWFGAAVFFTFGAGPAAVSPEMQRLLGQNNYPFFSVAIGQLLATRYFHWHLVCSLVALLHLVAEWLYFGKYPRRLWLGLLLALCLIGVVQAYGLQPRLQALHRLEHARVEPELQQAAARSFRLWHGAALVLDVLMVAGLAVYVWRVANPTDPMRFVSASKFRS